MKYSEARQGRIFIIRLEDGEIVHEQLEQFARDNLIERAHLIIIGGADKGSRLVVGPEESRSLPVMPMTHELYDAHEITGTGTIFPDDEGNMVLHLHMACGREENTVTGCIRNGVRVWHVMEVVLTELLENTASRQPDPITGFKLLIP
ncbi:MAG: DNA-binding protein [Chlorobium sp.]|jgi:predicted DNA-binding protein with PD1-like motif|uniref:PPC domain-containing DNA-binding protein n=1 Tax=Chlorobium sp. TaxID=1095 RepID=UPI001D336D6E|nr:PPC domain-containing DNA-binding protein [Chlorobium sp.]MBN1279490.1 DNA-binding protein [Chlorobiaceae bacterium]MCF8216489.1 DNA-binding protein [Chlorobium sp.]MCF8271394.1 DNA-binding protein [Chlorobium sp.]MCF8287766.1 DNA-binding protein [Chlorobium sp.]MCF8291305.1 DNA-binding protein [Chlorobium sp.]